MDKSDSNNSAFGNSLLDRPQTPEPTCSVELSERDADAVMAAAENPPAPSEAALQAARRFLRHHG
jgi:hypothetical protein